MLIMRHFSFIHSPVVVRAGGVPVALPTEVAMVVAGMAVVVNLTGSARAVRFEQARVPCIVTSVATVAAIVVLVC